MKFWKLVSIVLALFTGVANAAIITENFTVSVASWDSNTEYLQDSVGTGFFTYDDALLTGAGTEYIFAKDGLAMSLNIFGQLFTEQNDVDYNEFPELKFIDGIVVELDYIVSEYIVWSGSALTDINQEGVSTLRMRLQYPAAGGGFEGDIHLNDVNPVPLPTAIWLFSSGLIGLIGLARYKKVSN